MRYIAEQVPLNPEERRAMRRSWIEEAKEALRQARADLVEAKTKELPTHRTAFVEIGPEDPRYESAPFEDQMHGSMVKACEELAKKSSGSIFTKLIRSGEFPTGQGIWRPVISK